MTPRMDVEVFREAGMGAALRGLSLSYKTNKSMIPVALKLKDKDGGHNKFLEMMIMWLDVTAPRYWWSEADTYRLSTKQSESTMHTLEKDLFSENVQDLFETPIHEDDLGRLRDCIQWKQSLWRTKAMLPEGFLQRRVWMMSVKTMRNIIQQRSNHRLPHWDIFIDSVLEQSDFKDFLL